MNVVSVIITTQRRELRKNEFGFFKQIAMILNKGSITSPSSLRFY